MTEHIGKGGARASAVGFLCWGSVLALVACSGRDDAAAPEGSDGAAGTPVVARVGEAFITADDLRSYLTVGASAPARGWDAEQLQRALDERVLEEALYQEALRQGLDRDPALRRDIRKLLIGRLLEAHLDREVWSREIDEEALRAYYGAHAAEFNRPAQVRVADLFVEVPASAGPEERSKLRARADELLDAALAARETGWGLGQLIEQHSDPPASHAKGNTGFFDAKGRPAGLDPALVEAAFAIERVGEMPKHVIEASDGYHVIMLTGKRSGLHVPLESVRRKLVHRMRSEEASRAREAYIEGLRARAEVTIDEQIARSLLEELRAESGDPGHPPRPAGRPESGPPPLPGTP